MEQRSTIVPTFLDSQARKSSKLGGPKKPLNSWYNIIKAHEPKCIGNLATGLNLHCQEEQQVATLENIIQQSFTESEAIPFF